jgi:hypothetical protein
MSRDALIEHLAGVDKLLAHGRLLAEVRDRWDGKTSVGAGIILFMLEIM